jgi:hypothetical protein
MQQKYKYAQITTFGVCKMYMKSSTFHTDREKHLDLLCAGMGRPIGDGLWANAGQSVPDKADAGQEE